MADHRDSSVPDASGQSPACPSILQILPVNDLTRIDPPPSLLIHARDRYQTDALPLTQEFIAMMLGVRRTSVSLAAHALQAAGLIRYRRGNIEITDREALEAVSCECYGTVRY